MALCPDILRCVECGGSVGPDWKCAACGTVFELASTGAPILMTAPDRRRFASLLDRDEAAPMQTEYKRRLKKTCIRKFYPPEPVYVDPFAPPIPEPRADGVHLWIGGAGLQLPAFINLDVLPAPGVDIVANAARLPIQSSSCDRVACLALLEHVNDPEVVVSEIARVLKSGGEVQVVAPFCHPYHAYPADYSRFSRERLTEMFCGFERVEVGIRTGPTTTMLTFLIYYLKLIFPVHGGNAMRRTLNRLLVGAVGWAIYPIKYLDAWMNRLPGAHVLANHFYVFARK